MASKVQKNSILFALFIVPLLFYIFLQLSTHNFAKLPIVTNNIKEIPSNAISFKDKVTIVTFIGSDFEKSRGELYNLNEKIYKKFYDYNDIQFISLYPADANLSIEKMKAKIAPFATINRWFFIPLSESEIKSVYTSFYTDKTLDTTLHTSEAFIIDKDLGLRRGKVANTVNSKKKGYHMKSVSELKKEMHDDVKVLLAEYRFSLKKNNKRKI